MFRPFAAFIGWRYTRSRRRDQFVSFMALISLLGMVLGVAALIVVLSVMNGFEAELRGRILALIPHGFVDAREGYLNDWQPLADDLARTPGFVAAAPYIGGSAMVSRSGPVRGVQLWAIDPQYEQQVSSVQNHVVSGHYENLANTSFGIVIGDILARQLDAMVGDSIDVILPQVTVTPLGVFPRQKRFVVTAIFRSGSQLDSTTVFINLQDGQRFYKTANGVSGLRIAATDLFAAGPLLQRWNARHNNHYSVRDWSVTQGSLFQSVKMEKTMVGLLLFVIVAIAAFNIVSILTMMVNEKRADIAVLRTMGSSPQAMMAVFMVQGAMIGFVGIAIGASIGIPIALNVGAIVESLEQLVGVHVFDPAIYFVTRIPSVVVAQDIVKISAAAWMLSLLAALYPSWRASQIHPAEALRYE